MRIKRTLPPAAAPMNIEDLSGGFKGLLRGQAEIESFKSDIKKHFRVKHCFLLSSGKAALTLILQALQQTSPDRDEVLIPAFTCYSVPSAIVRAGLKVRLCDVDPATLDFDFNELKINVKKKDKLLAIVCPHLFGLPANLNKVHELLSDRQITIIEDAAQAMGGNFRGKLLGTLEDIGFFSLGRGKAFSTVAGGVIVTNSDQLAQIIDNKIQKITPQSDINKVQVIVYALAISALMHPSIFWLPKSMPGLRLGETVYDPRFPIKRFSGFQAGLARNWRKRITLFQTLRKQNMRYWGKILSRFSWLQPIFTINKSFEETFPLLRLPVLVQTASLRDTLLEISERRGLGIMPSYPTSIDKIEKLKYLYNGKTYPGAKQCANQLVTFPVHGLVSAKDRLRIVDSLEKLRAIHRN